MTKFVVGRGLKQKIYDLTLIPNFVKGDKTWMKEIIDAHPEYTNEELLVKQTLILNKQEANMLRGVRAKEKREGTKDHPGGGVYMMLCVLTGAKLREPILSGRTEDKYPGFTSWDNLKVMQEKRKEETEKQAGHIGNRGPRARKGKGGSGAGRSRVADERTPPSATRGADSRAKPGSGSAGAPPDDTKGAGGMEKPAQAQFRNSSNPYAI